MSVKRYMWELYDRPKASLLHLKAQMVIFEVVDVLLYRYVTLTILKVPDFSPILANVVVAASYLCLIRQEGLI